MKISYEFLGHILEVPAIRLQAFADLVKKEVPDARFLVVDFQQQQ